MICNTASRCLCLSIAQCDDNKIPQYLYQFVPFQPSTTLIQLMTGHKMPYLVSLSRIHTVQGNSLSQMDSLSSLAICNPYSGVLKHTSYRFLLLLQITLCNCICISFMPKYVSVLTTGTYPFNVFNTLSGL